MNDILRKFRYGSQERIAVLNAPNEFRRRITRLLPGVQIDTEINARYLYDFMIAFATATAEIEKLGPDCIHNLSEDGKLWLAFPKATSGRYTTDISRDHGWESMGEAGFRRVEQVPVDDDWTALRFRNSRFVRSAKHSG